MQGRLWEALLQKVRGEKIEKKKRKEGKGLVKGEHYAPEH